MGPREAHGPHCESQGQSLGESPAHFGKRGWWSSWPALSARHQLCPSTVLLMLSQHPQPTGTSPTFSFKAQGRCQARPLGSFHKLSSRSLLTPTLRARPTGAASGPSPRLRPRPAQGPESAIRRQFHDQDRRRGAVSPRVSQSRATSWKLPLCTKSEKAFTMLLLTFSLEGGVPVENLIDLGSNPVLQKGHSLVGSGFPPQSPWLEGWGAGCPRWAGGG